ncbi:hypothetical protein PFISCL1PPCAC_11981, partial [Pristionchus fissidentatus]
MESDSKLVNRILSSQEQVDRARTSGNKKKEMEVRQRFGALLRTIGKRGEAIDQYSKALSLSELLSKYTNTQSLIRALMELSAEDGNAIDFMIYLQKYEQVAVSAAGRLLAQYYAACCMVAMYRGTQDREWLSQAKQRAHQATWISKENMRAAGRPAETEGQLSKLLAEIHGILGERKHAEECLKSALALGVNEYEIVKIRFDFEWSDKLVVASRLSVLARDDTERVKAGLEVAKAHYKRQSMEEGIFVLVNLHKTLLKAEQKKKWERQEAYATRAPNHLRKEWERLSVLAYKALKPELGGMNDGEILEKFKEDNGLVGASRTRGRPNENALRPVPMVGNLAGIRKQSERVRNVAVDEATAAKRSKGSGSTGLGFMEGRRDTRMEKETRRADEVTEDMPGLDYYGASSTLSRPAEASHETRRDPTEAPQADVKEEVHVGSSAPVQPTPSVEAPTGSWTNISRDGNGDRHAVPSPIRDAPTASREEERRSDRSARQFPMNPPLRVPVARLNVKREDDDDSDIEIIEPLDVKTEPRDEFSREQSRSVMRRGETIGRETMDRSSSIRFFGRDNSRSVDPYCRVPKVGLKVLVFHGEELM